MPTVDDAPKQALAVGIADYRRFQTLVRPVRDARAVAAVLNRDYGFEVERLLDQQATRAAVIDAVERGLAEKRGQLVIFFAGHGLPIDRAGYLLPVDARPDDPSTYIDLSWLVRRCLASDRPQILLIVDACHGGHSLVRAQSLDDGLAVDPRRQRLVRQVLCAGGPAQAVRDDGGHGHSVFTHALLTTLTGFTAAHDDDGALRFAALRDRIGALVAERLGAAGGEVQQVVGGNLAGTIDPRGFVLRPRVGRLPARLIGDLIGSDPARRTAALPGLARACRHDPRRLADACRFALRSLTGGIPAPPPRRPPPLPAAPGAAERRAAALVLAALAGLAAAQRPRVAVAGAVLRATATALVRGAVDDDEGAVRVEARKALSGLDQETQTRVGRRLQGLRRSPPPRCRYAWEALATRPFSGLVLAPAERPRALVTRCRLAAGSAWRRATASRLRRRLLAAGVMVLLVLELGLVSRYYLHAATGGALIVRLGHPAVTALPPSGLPVVVAEHGERDLDDPRIGREARLRGSWLPLRHGVWPWAGRLATHLEPDQAVLLLWRLDDRRAALERLRAAASAGRLPVAVSAYLALADDALTTPAVNLLVDQLATDGGQGTARAALTLVRDARPAGLRAALRSLNGRGSTATEQAAVREALALLAEESDGDGDGDGGGTSPSAATSHPQTVDVHALAARVAANRPAAERAGALRRLAALRGDDAVPIAVAALLAAAADGDLAVRSTAFDGLVSLAVADLVPAARLEPILRAGLQDPSPSLRLLAAESLAVLTDRLPQLRDAALTLLASTVAAEDSMQRRLVDDLPERLAAAPAAASAVVRWLGAALAREGAPGGHPGLRYLAAIAEQVPATLPALIDVALDLHLRSLDAGSELLWRLRSLPVERRASVLTQLFEHLEAGEPARRVFATQGIADVAAKDEQLSRLAASRLIPAATDPEPPVASAAIASLATLRKAGAALPAGVLGLLRTALGSEHVPVRTAAAKALAETPPVSDLAAPMVDALTAGLDAADSALRLHTADALARWLPAAPRRIPALRPRLAARLRAEPEPAVRLAVAGALLLAGGDVRAAGPVIVAGLRAGDPRLRWRALQLVRRLTIHGYRSGPPFALLAVGFESRDPSELRMALLTLFEIAVHDCTRAEAALALLRGYLRDPQWPGRWDAVNNAIEPIGRHCPAAAEEAAAMLWRLLDTLEAHTVRERSLIGTTAEKLIELTAMIADRRPETLWPLVGAFGPLARRTGRQALVRMADRRPDRIPALRRQLARLRRSWQPERRLSAARADEMLCVLEHTRTAIAGGPLAIERWRRVLDALPAEAGLGAAVTLAEDRLAALPAQR